MSMHRPRPLGRAGPLKDAKAQIIRNGGGAFPTQLLIQPPGSGAGRATRNLDHVAIQRGCYTCNLIQFLLGGIIQHGRVVAEVDESSDEPCSRLAPIRVCSWVGARQHPDLLDWLPLARRQTLNSPRLVPQWPLIGPVWPRSPQPDRIQVPVGGRRRPFDRRPVRGDLLLLLDLNLEDVGFERNPARVEQLPLTFI